MHNTINTFNYYCFRSQFKKFTRSTPTVTEIISNLRNIFQSDCRIPYLTTVMNKIYAILEVKLYLKVFVS